jgi:hypothetical protein
MTRVLALLTFGALATFLAACGGGSGGSAAPTGSGSNTTPPAPLVSYLGTTGVFVAWSQSSGAGDTAASTTTYAGKKQILRGSTDFMSGAALAQAAGLEVYKGSDGHIHGLDLTSTSTPAPQQISSESAATVDDRCTLSGTEVTGANYDYVGVYFSADLVTPTKSSYFYRLPGPDGVCNTADDVFHMVTTGMSAPTAPIVVTAMPVATVHTSTGDISGYVIKDGANLTLVDENFANPTVLGTFANTIGVAVALPVGTTQGYPTGQLYVVDGNIVYVNYASHSVSAALFAIPGWLPTNPEALFAGSPDSLYFSTYTPASGSTPASAAIYSMPSNGSAVPASVDSEPGRVETLVFPVSGTSLVWGVANPTYTIRTLPAAGATARTLASSGNAGTFIATASTVYYDTWTVSTDKTTNTVTRNGTQSGIVGLDGTVIQAPLTGSTFVNGGEQAVWPNDTVTTTTAYQTVFQVRNLTTVTVNNPQSGTVYVSDGVSGGTLVAIDTTSNQPIGTLGTLPTSNATYLSGTFRASGHEGFLEVSTALSTEDPLTRDLYLVNSQTANSLVRVTNTL